MRAEAAGRVIRGIISATDPKQTFVRGNNNQRLGAADFINRTAPFLLQYPMVTNYWTRFTVTGTGRHIVLQTGE